MVNAWQAVQLNKGKSFLIRTNSNGGLSEGRLHDRLMPLLATNIQADRFRGGGLITDLQVRQFPLLMTQ